MKCWRPTEAEVRDYLQRHRSRFPLSTKLVADVDNCNATKQEPADPGPESDLQGKIQQWARSHGHPCLSFRMAKNAKGFLPPGWPDITLILPQRVLFIELKSKRGRLTPEQKNTKIKFLNHGHEIYEVRSFKRFLEIINHREA
jgi:hypothetical protein